MGDLGVLGPLATIKTGRSDALLPAAAATEMVIILKSRSGHTFRRAHCGTYSLTAGAAID